MQVFFWLSRAVFLLVLRIIIYIWMMSWIQGKEKKKVKLAAGSFYAQDLN